MNGKTEARDVGDGDAAVDGAYRFGEVVSQGRAFLFDELKQVEGVRDACEKVQRGGDVEVCREPMVDDLKAAVGGE